MLNQTVLVGRLVDITEIKELENGKKVTNITLAVPRNFKNSDGEYETDFIDCILTDSIAKNTKKYCKKEDIIGVKGRVRTILYEKDDVKIKNTEIIAEKVTFLSSSKSEKKEEN